MQHLGAFLRPIIIGPDVPQQKQVGFKPPKGKPGRPRINAEVMTVKQRTARSKAKRREERVEDIAILDFETDPFDNQNPDAKVLPFLCVLYREGEEPIVIWEENYDVFVVRVLAAITALPRKFTIYAHNGGRFDYMFLLHELRGQVSFKGAGIMCAKIGNHELRDSFHLIPERLANLQKDNFDYRLMSKDLRGNHREQIITYCIHDCEYLLTVIKEFIGQHGFHLSIGQAAMSRLKGIYDVENLDQHCDAFLRNYFFGGRVECLAGRGHFISGHQRHGYKLYDVNSMYPHCMAAYKHPVGKSFTLRHGAPGPNTFFIELQCRNYGALVKRGDDGEISAEIDYGTFRTTVWEYNTALKYGLIEDVQIKWCIDFDKTTDFADYINPLYEHRKQVKATLKTLTEGSAAYLHEKMHDIFDKLFMNNAYGKFAQNPRKFKECYVTGPDERPPVDCPGCLAKWPRDEHGWHPNMPKEIKCAGDDCPWCEVEGEPENGKHVIAKSVKCRTWGRLPRFECERYWIWERPQTHLRFNNVATAASITGASRAILMEAIANSVDPIYCDTDSLVCRDLIGAEIGDSNLGAWKLEAELDEMLIAGKKLYACKVAGFDDCHPKRIKVRSKGVSGLTWRDVQAVLDGDMIEAINKGVTMSRDGSQYYMRRNVRATATAARNGITRRVNNIRKTRA